MMQVMQVAFPVLLLRLLLLMLVQEQLLLMLVVQQEEIVKMVLPFILPLIVGEQEMLQLFLRLLLGIRFHKSHSTDSICQVDTKYRYFWDPRSRSLTTSSPSWQESERTSERMEREHVA